MPAFAEKNINNALGYFGKSCYLCTPIGVLCHAM